MSDNKNSNYFRKGGGHQILYRTKTKKLKKPKKIIKRLVEYLKDYKVLLLLVLVFAFISTMVTIIGTRLNGYTLDEFISTGDMKGLANICCVLVGIYIIGAVLVYFQNIFMIDISQKITAKIRKDLFEKIEKLPLKYFDTHSSGDLMSRITNDIDNINTILSQSVVRFFTGIVNIIGMFIAMILLSLKLTLVVLITIPLMFIITKFIAKKTWSFFANQQKELGNINGYVEEMISGQKAVILFSREKYVKEEFSKINKRLTKNAIVSNALSGLIYPLNNFANNLNYLIIAVVGAYFILNDMNITTGIVFTFLLYMRRFTRPINEILNLFNTIMSALAGAERVFEIMNEKEEKDKVGVNDLHEVKGNVIFNNVSFSYVKGKEILKNISLKVKVGDTVAIVGPTGAGKTTIINLLTKFYDIDGGQMKIDNQDISQISIKSLRKSISIVLQDTFLFSESIKENIRYGRLDATDGEVEIAATKANADCFIRQLSDGYNTVLSDNGSDLSQGQRQLISIARAVLSKAEILILDEATSSVDTMTEVKIQQALKTLMKDKTTFIIAHRLSTIKKADQIVVVKAGEIIERGTHKQLMNFGGFYAELYNSQFKKIENISN